MLTNVARGLLAGAAIAPWVDSNFQAPFVVSPQNQPLTSSAVKISQSELVPLLDGDFDNFLSSLTKDWGFRGMGVAVVRNHPNNEKGKWHVETKGYGMKDSSEAAVTNETLFSICSNSKLFTTLAVGLLVDNPSVNLTWSTKVKDILPDEWVLQDKVAEERANLLDLMSHRTGLPRHDFAWSRPSVGSSFAAVRLLRHLKPSCEFRECWQYNNYMYAAMAAIVERVSGTEFEEFVTSKIFEPLNMTSTTYNATAAQEGGHLAQAFGAVNIHAKHGGEGPLNITYHGLPFFIRPEFKVMSGPGGVLSNPNDISIWLRMLLLEGLDPATGNRVIPASVVRRAITGVSVSDGQPAFPELSVTAYGGGQGLYSYRGHNAVEHTGGWTGWLSKIVRFPTDGFGLAVFTNFDEGMYFMEIVAQHLTDKAFGLSAVDWNSRYNARVPAVLDPPTTPPEESNPPNVPYESFVGRYYNPGYGAFDLCSSKTDDLSETCKKAHLQEEAVQRQTNVPTAAGHQLIVAISGEIFNHIQLTHFSGNLFNATCYFLAHITPGTEDYSDVVVVPSLGSGKTEITFEFDVKGDKVDGLGVAGIWGAGATVQPLAGDTVRERAEVWLDRD